MQKNYTVHSTHFMFHSHPHYTIQWNLIITRSEGPQKSPRHSNFSLHQGKKSEKHKEPGPTKLPVTKESSISDLPIMRLHCMLRFNMPLQGTHNKALSLSRPANTGTRARQNSQTHRASYRKRAEAIRKTDQPPPEPPKRLRGQDKLICTLYSGKNKITRFSYTNE